jgi:hypothetical protein
MKIRDHLQTLVEELDSVHGDQPIDWSRFGNFPNFVTANTGVQRHFTQKALKAIRDISRLMHVNQASLSSVMELKILQDIVRICAANLHAQGLLSANDVTESQQRLSKAIQDVVTELRIHFTHHIPAKTLGFELQDAFPLGPVTVYRRDKWIESTRFAPVELKMAGLAEDEEWRAKVRAGLSGATKSGDHDSLSESVLDSIRSYNSVLTVDVAGYEQALSEKVAHIVCKSALDAVSLAFVNGRAFQQQTLHGERLGPTMTTKMIGIDGLTRLPGWSLGPQIPVTDPKRARAQIDQYPEVFQAMGSILSGLLAPGSSPHPDLAKRWTTALDWLAEGCRERNDAVGLAKVATSLDVLACGGRYQGILDMLVNLLGIPESFVVVSGEDPLTLADLVKRVYDSGRSQILHGTHFDRLKSFEVMREYGIQLSARALLEAALRLHKYAGKDDTKAFRTM